MHKSIAVFLLSAFASASISLRAVPAMAESLYSAAILSDSPLGYWRLGEPGGATTAIDSSSGGHNGAYVGNVTLGIPGAIAGDPNTAANFGGTTGYVSVGAQPTFDLANNFTIEAWIQPSSFTGFQRIASTFDNSAGVAGYGFGLDGTRMVFTAFGQADYVANFTTATSQNWHQVVVTFQANNVATFYLDGQPTQSIAASAPVAAGNGPFTIGGRPPTSSSEAFNGGIDEVAVYHGSLSAAQILQHYDASRPWTDKTVAVLNTGVDASQNKLADGAPDSKYIIGPGGTGGHVGETPIAISNPISASWLPDNVSAASRWIGLSGGPPNGHAVGGGTYFFDTTVNLTGYQPMTAEIQGLRTSADNALLAIFVNGHQVFAKADTFMGEFDEWQYLGSVGLGFFTSGRNTIQFEVENQPNTITDMGLRLEGSVVAAAVPEPSGLALAALAGPALLACRRRQ